MHRNAFETFCHIGRHPKHFCLVAQSLIRSYLSCYQGNFVSLHWSLFGAFYFVAHDVIWSFLSHCTRRYLEHFVSLHRTLLNVLSCCTERFSQHFCLILHIVICSIFCLSSRFFVQLGQPVLEHNYVIILMVYRNALIF